MFPDVVRIKVDFESGLIAALRTVFPNAVIEGCNFHFCQDILRWVNENRLMPYYKEDYICRILIRMTMALAFLPLPEGGNENQVNEITEGFDMIRAATNYLRPIINPLHNYFANQWMDNIDNDPENGKIALAMWNVHGQKDRTNNVSESFNSALAARFKENHPVFCKFTSVEL